MSSDRYSRTIATLKIALPLLALGILSTLFLVSRAVTPTPTIPFADEEVRQRLSNHQITEPYFSGMTPQGDQIAFVAKSLQSPDGTLGSNTAKDVRVSVNLADGTAIELQADTALIDIARDSSELRGNVKIDTSLGHQFHVEHLVMKLSRLDISSPAKIAGWSPKGKIEAGNMHVFLPNETNDLQWVFRQDVKLLYHPKIERE